MIRIFFVVLMTSWLMGSPDAALAKKTQSGPKKSSTVPSQASFTVVYGDQISHFTILRAASGGKIEFSNSKNRSSVTQISESDVQYLLKRVAQFPKGSNRVELCRRTYVEVLVGTQKKIGCLGSSNALAKEIQETVNLLSVLI